MLKAISSIIAPSKEIKEPQKRARAELLLALILLRIFMTSLMLIVFVSTKIDGNIGMVFSILVANLVAFRIGKTTKFELAACLVIVEPLIGIPLAIYSSNGAAAPSICAPMWLVLGPFISSVLLPMRYTAAIVVATVASFGGIYFIIDHAYLFSLSNQFLAVLVCSFVALIGTYLRDRTDRALGEEKAKVIQSAKLASLGEMAAGIAHELNTPLAAISLNAELLEDEIAEVSSKNEALLSRVKNIGGVADRMAKIITGLRTFARDANDENFELVPVEKWILDTLNLCRQRFQSAGINLELSDENFEVVCLSQSIQLSQVLLNLLNNSFDAVKLNKEKWIRIEARKTSNHLEVLVTDSGLGISKEKVDLIFQPFFTTKEIGAGTGLGLSISRGILQSHNGELIYDKNYHHTRFIMKIPLAKLQEAI